MNEYGGLTGFALLRAMHENGDERVSETVAMLQEKGILNLKSLNFRQKNNYNSIVVATTRQSLLSDLREY